MKLSANLQAWLEGKTLEDFQAIEHGPRLLFPDAIARRDAKGALVEDPVLIRVPGADDVLAGRFDAIAYVNKVAKKNGRLKEDLRTLQEARDAVGLDHFENLENAAIVVRCLHEIKPPHNLAFTLEMLRATYLPQAISSVFQRMEVLNQMLAIDLDDLTEEQFWGAVEVIGRKQSIAPLGVMRGNIHAVFLVRACLELRAAREALAEIQQTPSSSSTSTETSTQGS